MPGETPRKKVGRGYARNTNAGVLETMVSSFELHLRAEHKSDKTIKTYLDAARWFAAAHLLPAGVSDWAEVRARHVQQWTVWLLASYADTYASNQFRALQQFFRWFATEDPDEPRPNPMVGLKPPKVGDKLVPVITDDELDAMLATCKGGGFENRRDCAIISLFKDTGIRLAELAGIALADVNVKGREAIITGKGDKQRTVRFTYGTARALDRYLRERARHRNARSSALWLGVRGGPMTSSGIGQIIERRGDAASLDVYPHKFRHTFSHTFQVGRVASAATFPQKCDHDAVGDAGRAHRGDTGACHRESAGQGRCMRTGCIKSIDVAPDFVALDDRLVQPLQRQRRSDEGRCRQRPIVQPPHSARRQQCSLPVWTGAGPKAT